MNMYPKVMNINLNGVNNQLSANVNKHGDLNNVQNINLKETNFHKNINLDIT